MTPEPLLQHDDAGRPRPPGDRAKAAAPTAPLLHTLGNGVRVVALPMPGLHTASVAVFVHTGSAHEDRSQNGISHVLEHMAFKGTRARDVHRVNLDAEALGAEVNAHTDKDHTAYTMRGLGDDAGDFVRMLADIVREATFPPDELEREREVLLQELAEVEDDPVSVGYQLFDGACWGTQAAAQPVIGQRRVIERVGRGELLQYVQRQYTGANVVVAAAGAIEPDALLRAADAAFADMGAGAPNRLPRADYAGGTRTRRMDGGQQTHLVLGFPAPARGDEQTAAIHDVAAAVLGDGMSSPLLAELREKRGLVYHAGAHLDRFEYGGQLAIEASFAPKHLDAVLRQTATLLARLADRVDAVDLERARNQLVVRIRRDQERPAMRIEQAALDLFTRGRLGAADARIEAVRAVDARRVREAFAAMLAAGESVALTGQIGRGATPRVRAALAALRG